MNRSICPIDETLTGTTAPSQSELGSNDNERVLHIPLIPRIRTSLSDAFQCPIQTFESCWAGVYTFAEVSSVYSTALVIIP